MLEHLPALLILTDREASASVGRSLADTVDALAGMRDVALVLREKDLSRPDRDRLGREVAESCLRGGLPLIVASDVRLASDLGADGVHLAAEDVDADPGRLTVGRSCHSLREIHRAEVGGADYATIGPVFGSRSKPGHGPAMGLETLAGFAAATALPVYALAGVEPGRAGPCVEAGAHGVAAMHAVMGAALPREVVHALVEEVHRAWVRRGVEAP